MRTLISASIVAVVCSLMLAAQAPANTKAAPKAAATAPAQAQPPENEMRARQMMVDALSDKNPDVRKQAVVSLGLVGAREPFISLVESMLTDKDVYVRLAAIASLVDLKSTRTVGALQKALYDEAPEVTYAAAKQLWAMNDPEGRKAMMAVLSGEAKTSSGFLTLQTRDRLRMLHTPKTMFLFALKEGVGFAPVPGLGDGVSSLQDLLSDSNVSGRATAALLMGRDKREDVLNALRDGLHDKDASVRAASVHSLALRNDPSLIEDIAPLLSDSRAPVRLRAAAAYVRLVWVKSGSPGSTEMKPVQPAKSAPTKSAPVKSAPKK